MNLYNQLIAGWSLYMILISIVSKGISLYDFLVLAAAWTLGCLMPCIDVPFYLNAKHQDRKQKREQKKAIKTANKKIPPLKKINTHRNRYFHTITMMFICCGLVFYLLTYQPALIEKIFHISTNYFYWGIGFCFTAGYATHILLDCFGYSPMPLFLLFVNDPYNLPIRIKRNSRAMKILTISLTIIFIACLIKVSKIVIR